MTSPSHRRILATMTGAVALLLLGAVGAWACTSSAQIALGASGGQPGSTVSVTGEQFVSGGTVEVYWEPNEGERQLLFETTGSEFAQNVTIPEGAPAGTHYVKAFGYENGPDSEQRGTATASFTVPHGAVQGQVVDQGDGSPVHAAQVTVSRNGTVVGNDTTNAEGVFRVEGLERGEHEVAVDRTNYQRSTAHTHVDLGETSQLNFDLAHEPQNEPESEPNGSGGSNDGDPEGSEGAEPQGSEGAEPQGSEPAPEPEGSEGAERPEGSEPADDGADEPGEPVEQPEAGDTSEPTEADQPAESDQPAGSEETGRSETGEPAQSETDEPAATEEPVQSTEPPASQQEPAEPAQENGGTEPASGEPAGQAEPASGEEPTVAVEADEVAEPLATAAERRGRVPASDSDLDLEPAAPSARSSAADLWSGLEAGSEAAMSDAQAADTINGPAGIGQQLAIALGLLGTGLVLLTGGGVVAVRRQRTAKAQRPSA